MVYLISIWVLIISLSFVISLSILEKVSTALKAEVAAVSYICATLAAYFSPITVDGG